MKLGVNSIEKAHWKAEMWWAGWFMSEIWQESWVQGHLELQSKTLHQNKKKSSVMNSDIDRIFKYVF